MGSFMTWNRSIACKWERNFYSHRQGEELNGGYLVGGGGGCRTINMSSLSQNVVPWIWTQKWNDLLKNKNQDVRKITEPHKGYNFLSYLTLSLQDPNLLWCVISSVKRYNIQWCVLFQCLIWYSGGREEWFSCPLIPQSCKYRQEQQYWFKLLFYFWWYYE